MPIIDTEKRVLESVLEDDTLSVTEMSRKLDVSQVTVRGILSGLEEKGVLVRTRGGAVAAFHPGIRSRQRLMTEQKKRIAREAASLVSDGDTVMIEAGTTTALIAKYLLGKRNIHVVTNSTLILPYARINPSLHLTLIGGEFKPETESVVGPIAIRELSQFHVGLAFIGTDGYSPATGLTSHHVEGAEAARTMAERADRCVLVADSTKFGRAGFAHELPITKISLVITDSGLSASSISELRKSVPEVRVVKS